LCNYDGGKESEDSRGSQSKTNGHEIPLHWRPASPQAAVLHTNEAGRCAFAPTIAARNRPTAASNCGGRPGGRYTGWRGPGHVKRISVPVSASPSHGIWFRSGIRCSIVALTVAGAAQVVSARTGFDPCFPFNPRRRITARAPTWPAKDITPLGAPQHDQESLAEAALIS
jgi:hypothetical protein